MDLDGRRADFTAGSSPTRKEVYARRAQQIALLIGLMQTLLARVIISEIIALSVSVVPGLNLRDDCAFVRPGVYTVFFSSLP